MTDAMSNELIARGPVLSIIAELDKRDAEIKRLRNLFIETAAKHEGVLIKRDDEIERLRGENDALKDEVELKAAALTGTSRVMGEEIERLRGLVYAVPPTEHATEQTWKEACEANRDEVARLDNLLRTYRLPDEVVDIKVVIELRAEIERLRGALEAITVVGFDDGAAGRMAKIALRALRVREAPGDA